MGPTPMAVIEPKVVVGIIVNWRSNLGKLTNEGDGLMVDSDMLATPGVQLVQGPPGVASI